MQKSVSLCDGILFCVGGVALGFAAIRRHGVLQPISLDTATARQLWAAIVGAMMETIGSACLCCRSVRRLLRLARQKQAVPQTDAIRFAFDHEPLYGALVHSET